MTIGMKSPVEIGVGSDGLIVLRVKDAEIKLAPDVADLVAASLGTAAQASRRASLGRRSDA